MLPPRLIDLTPIRALLRDAHEGPVVLRISYNRAAQPYTRQRSVTFDDHWSVESKLRTWDIDVGQFRQPLSCLDDADLHIRVF